MTLTSRSPMWVMMVQHKTSDQYLTSGKVSIRSIHRFKRYRLLKTLTKNFNILSNADAVVTAIALPVLMYRRAKKQRSKQNILVGLTTAQRFLLMHLFKHFLILMALKRFLCFTGKQWTDRKHGISVVFNKIEKKKNDKLTVALFLVSYSV